MDIVRCTECRHPDYEHCEEQIPSSKNCSFGWCGCSLLRPQVVATGEPAVVTPVPAFDHATGKWATR